MQLRHETHSSLIARQLSTGADKKDFFIGLYSLFSAIDVDFA